MEYKKRPLTYDQQIDLLESRGLIFQNREKARSILQRISYYRLSAYWIPFQSCKDCFNKDATIEKVVELYNFDRELRTIVFDSLQIVEISIRTFLTYYLSNKYGAFGYADPQKFSTYFKNHQKWLDDLNNELKRSREVFISHYKNKYHGSKYFPIWIVTEVISFGALSQLFAGLRAYDQKEISKHFKAPHIVFKSWLHNLVYVRNICAHHARLWNRSLAIKPKIPKNIPLWHKPYTIPNGKVFSTLSVLYYMMKIIDSGSDNFKKQIKLLFSRYSDINLGAMGISDNWDKHEIWN